MSAENQRTSRRQRARTIASLVTEDSSDSETEGSAEPSVSTERTSATERSASVVETSTLEDMAVEPSDGHNHSNAATARPDSENESEREPENALPDSGLPGSALPNSENESERSAHYDSSGSDTEKMDGPDTDPPPLHEALAAWAKATKQTPKALNGLLDLLRKHGDRLPKDARTLLAEDLATDSDFSDVDSTQPGQSFSPAKKRQRTQDSSQTPVAHPQRGVPRRPAIPGSHPIPNAEFQRVVLEMLDEMKEDIQRINRSMGMIDNHSDSATASAIRAIRKLESEGEFNSFDEEMNNREERMILVQQLARVGGSSLRDCINNMMDRMMSVSLMSKFNMMGKGHLGKKRFTSTAMYGVIQDAVMRWSSGTTVCSNVTLYDIDLAIGDHLKHSPARVGAGRRPT